MAHTHRLFYISAASSIHCLWKSVKTFVRNPVSVPQVRGKSCEIPLTRPYFHRTFREEKRKKHARTLRERGAPRVSKMAVILIFLFSTIYYASADIPVSSDNFPTQEDSCRYSLAVVRFSYCFLNFKKDFKALDIPAACKQIASISDYIRKPLNI